MSLDLPVMLIIVLFLALGIFSQWLATQIKWPSIVVMSIVGLLIGPILGLVNPQETLGAEVFSPIVSLAVAVILFEGSSNLDFRELRGISKAVIRIITVGAAISWVLGAIALHKILDFPISVAVVMGGLFLITGPTVIQPLLKQAKVRKSVDSILRWESIILDPIGPILALTAFYIYQIFEQGFGVQVILIFILKMVITAIIGFGASFVFNWLIQRDFIPQNLMPSIQLVFILLVFSICDQILQESGLLAVTIFGLMMAPRGIVVLTVAQFFGGLFMDDHVKMASYITPVTFGLVFITVVIYGFSFTPLSKLLGLASTEPPGVIIVGESEFSFHLGMKLHEHDIPIMVFNLFENTSEKAEELGFEVFKGNLLSSSDRIYADLIRYNKCLLMTKSFIFNSLAFNELVPEFGLNNVSMMPVSFTDEQARNNLNGPLRNHILFDESHSPRWFDNTISNKNIVEVLAEEYDTITDHDMIIYHVDDNSVVSFNKSTKPIPQYDQGTYGILRDVY